MKHTKHDRRSERTRRLLGAALVELMAEKRYDDITVQDLLERANIGRSTFYSHYMDMVKEDLLLNEFERVVKQLEQHAASVGDTAAQLLPSLELLRHIRDNQHLYKALVWGRSIEFTFRNMQRRLADLVEENLALQPGAGGTAHVPLPVLATFVVGTFLTLVNWWLDGKTSYSVEDMEAMFRRLVMPAVQSAIAVQH